MIEGCYGKKALSGLKNNGLSKWELVKTHTWNEKTRLEVRTKELGRKKPWAKTSSTTAVHVNTGSEAVCLQLMMWQIQFSGLFTKQAGRSGHLGLLPAYLVKTVFYEIFKINILDILKGWKAPLCSSLYPRREKVEREDDNPFVLGLHIIDSYQGSILPTPKLRHHSDVPFLALGKNLRLECYLWPLL